MNSNQKDDDAGTNYVLDYYKKFSQNRELPKYFSGTSVSYLPEIKGTVSPETEVASTIKTDVRIIVTDEDATEVPEKVGEPVGTSRAGSPMSNHRLEWDSGADIGYGNCQEKRLRKSLSLPIIANLIEKRPDVDFGPVTSNPAFTRSQSSSSDGNVKVVLLTCSSSSEDYSDENDMDAQLKNKESSSSSSSNANVGVIKKNTISISSSDSSNQQNLKQFASTLSYLKQKIGLPGAHSTPKFPDERQSISDVGSSTPVLKKSSSSNGEGKAGTSKEGKSNCRSKKLTRKPDTLIVTPTAGTEEVVEKISDNSCGDGRNGIMKYQNAKVVNLVVTKPITVECTCSGQNLGNKLIQTTTKQSSVAVQTDEVTEKELIQIIQNAQKNFGNQSLMYFEYSESDNISARSTQTGSDIIESNCDSFEYLTKKPAEPKKGILQKAVSSTEIKSGVPGKAESVLPEQGANLVTQRTYGLRNTPSEDHSEKSSSKDFCLGNLVSAALLDNVEDDIGKSIYLLQRLLKSKKYDPVTKKRYIKKIIKRITESKYLEESSTSSDLFVPKKLPKTDPTGNKNEGNLLQSNVPWCPAGESLKLSPKRKKLVQKTFAQNFVPEQHSSREEISSAPEIVPINSRDMRKNRFTLTNNEFSVNHRFGNVEENKSGKTSETDSTSLEKHYESASTSKSYENWREDKTLSEKMLEKQSQEKFHSSNGNGDCLVKFADKEREFQISWINNEISHLGKLKGLLEKPKNPLDVKKMTNIYTVFNKNDTESKPKRNYVIETLVGTQSSSEMNFKLDGQVYTVEEFLNPRKKRETKRSRPVTGNIEVVSSDSTTNIRVTTFCEDCKRSLCICSLSEQGESCTCDLDVGKICDNPYCKRIPTKKSVQGQGYGTLASSSHRDIYVCPLCKRCPCVCNTNYKQSAKTITNSSDDITGTFIPVAPSRAKVKFSTYPSTFKEEYRRGQTFELSSQETDVVHKATSTISKSSVLQRDQAEGSGSLRKVFENCCCTQSNCTCDFVKKLINRFSKTEIPHSIACACQQTDQNEIQTIGLQAHVETQNQNQQTTALAVDDKCLQTEKHMSKSESQTIGIQTLVNQNIQMNILSDAQTGVLRLEENYQNIGIQAVTQVSDEILQTSVEQQSVSKNSVSTHISINGGTQTKGVSFVNKSTSSATHSVSTSPDLINKQKDAFVSATRDSDDTSLRDIKKQQDATTSPMIRAVDAITSSRMDLAFAEYIKKQVVVGSLQANEFIRSHSDSSQPTSPSKSSTSTSGHRKKKVLHVCCCTQTESKPHVKSQRRNVKVQIESSGTHSDKENVKHKSYHMTTSSTTYEICPSILVSSYNEMSQSISEGSSSKPPLILCVCCNSRYPSDNISVLGSKNENYPICCNCLAKRPILTSVCYAGPEENCPCSKPHSSKLVRPDLSNETKKTTTDSNDFEEYCTCTKPFQFKNSKYCAHCQFKLRNTARSKNGIAYTLTLETGCLNKIRRRIKKIPLEEIKLKVPSPSKKKKHKDKENVSKKNKGDDKERKCCCGTVICTSNCHIHGVSSKHKIYKDSFTLQEYLQKNRPDFIQSAESRRHVVLNSKHVRLFDQGDAKLQFAQENMGKYALIKQRKLFTEQEMREITKRNYKKLPEVKQKISSQREERLRSADRFIVDVFARKIQRSVLKGKSSFPIDSNVICLPKICNC